MTCLRFFQAARKTKLGLREFVSLGDFEQIIDTESKTAVRYTGTRNWHASHMSQLDMSAMHMHYLTCTSLHVQAWLADLVS